MRSVYELNKGWAFRKTQSAPPAVWPEEWEKIELPHTWNARDGQDGGNDYFRGICCYVKRLYRSELPESEAYFLEINGANSSADVYLNGLHLAHHDGGYSTFRVELTEALREENLLAILVDNTPNETVYPQMADFTFYGGLYRSVDILCVPAVHFSLEPDGTPGIRVTPLVKGRDARVEIEAQTTPLGPEDKVICRILDAEGRVAAEGEGGSFLLENARLWQGRKDPYLYIAQASILRGEGRAVTFCSYIELVRVMVGLLILASSA